MNGQEQATSDVADATPATAAAAPVETFQCVKCGREFGSAIALQTHEIRAHKRFWSTKGKPRRSKSQRGRSPLASTDDALLAKRRKYYRTYVARLKARGLTTKGTKRVRVQRFNGGRKPEHLPKTCPVCSRTFSTRAIMGHHLRAIHGKSLTQFKNGAAPMPLRAKNTTCPACGKRYERRAYLAIHTRKTHGKSITELEQQQSTGEAEQIQPRAERKPQHQPGREIIFCPVCGTNIHAVRTAVNLADQH